MRRADSAADPLTASHRCSNANRASADHSQVDIVLLNKLKDLWVDSLPKERLRPMASPIGLFRNAGHRWLPSNSVSRREPLNRGAHTDRSQASHSVDLSPRHSKDLDLDSLVFKNQDSVKNQVWQNLNMDSQFKNLDSDNSPVPNPDNTATLIGEAMLQLT